MFQCGQGSGECSGDSQGLSDERIALSWSGPRTKVDVNIYMKHLNGWEQALWCGAGPVSIPLSMDVTHHPNVH